MQSLKAFGLLYAMSDEYHQTFVMGRSGELRDVLIDSLGIITGIVLTVLILKLFKSKKGEETIEK